MAAHGEQRATLIDRHSYRSPADRPPVERPIRLGVIGLGPRGRGNVVGKALAYAEYELAAVCDRRANIVGSVVETVERDHGHRVAGFTDYERMLREVEPDAVAVTTDVSVQIPIACAAMESGCHAMVEVPLCSSMEDCWRVVATAERTGTVFMLMEQVSPASCRPASGCELITDERFGRRGPAVPRRPPRLRAALRAPRGEHPRP